MTFQTSLEGASSPAPPRDQMTTRGVKRLASVSVGGHASPGGSGSEPKKRRRHNLMFDAIRKAAKKREQNQKANGRKECMPNPHLHELMNIFQQLRRNLRRFMIPTVNMPKCLDTLPQS
jgi:hypothetical protein